VVRRRDGRVDHEAAAVEVHEDGHLLMLGGEEVVGDVEAGKDAGGAVDDDVLGGDPGDGIKARQGGLRPVEALDTAVVVNAEERRIEYQFCGWIHD